MGHFGYARGGSLLPTGVVLGHLVATRSVLARLGAFCGIFTVQKFVLERTHRFLGFSKSGSGRA